MQQVWRFHPPRRLSMPCKEIPVQKLSQIWALHKLMLHERPAKASISQAPQTKVHQLTAGTIQAYNSQVESESSDDSFCLQLQIKHVQAKSKVDKKPACSITNLPYRLKQHKNRNLYSRARLDTCADVNIMAASVYKLVFHDPNLESLA